MPFVMSYPRKLPGGSSFDGIATNVDLAQTILDAAGIPAHGRMQGRSFWPDVTTGAVEPPNDGLYYRYWENDSSFHHVLAHYGYRDNRYKIIYFYNDGMGIPGSGDYTFPPEWELYDLENDPDELHNVYFDPAYAEIREEPKVKMWKKQAEVGDVPHPSQPMPAGV